MENQKIYLITYGSGKYDKAKYRLKQQAEAFGVFDDIFVYGYEDLNDERFDDCLKQSKNDYNVHRGLPRILLINKCLEKIEDNSILLYLDAGFVIYPQGKERFYEYIDFVNKNEILTMKLNDTNNGLLEKIWTSKYLFDYFKIPIDSDIANSSQIESGFIMLKNTKNTKTFMEEFQNYVLNDVNLITKKYNNIDKIDCFRDNRHEQSLLSLLLKKQFNTDDISIKDETWPPGAFPGNKKPFLARRSTEGPK